MEEAERPRGGMVALAASRLAFALSGTIVNLAMARALVREEFGVFRWVSAVVALATFGSNLGLGAFVTQRAAREPARVPKLVPAALRATLLLSSATLLLVVAYVALRDPRPAVLVCGLLAGVGLGVQAMSQVVEGALHGLHHTRAEVPSVLVGRALLVVGSLALLAAGFGLVAQFAVRLIAAAVAWGMLVLALRRVSGGLDWAHPEPPVRDLVAAGRVFGATVLFGAIYAQADVLMIEALVSDAEVARYGAPSSVLLQLALVSNVVTRSFFPRLAAHPDRARELLRLQTRVLLTAGVPVAAGGLAVASRLVPALFGDPYVDSVLPFQILVCVVPIRFLNNGYGLALTALDQQGRRARIDGLAATFNVLANLIAVPWAGAVGAAATTLLTDALLLVLLRWQLSEAAGGLRELDLVVRAALGAVIMAGLVALSGLSLPAQIALGVAVWGLVVPGAGLLRRESLRELRHI
ncbi:MAG TPA: oligosaccharide flippase family protein [Myxococcota bacterium]|nr:oligosaccharide flippase family protein [Myxococcota bacterium]